jgi:hypothetical protein
MTRTNIRSLALRVMAVAALALCGASSAIADGTGSPNGPQPTNCTSCHGY